MILIDGFSQNLAMKMFTFKVDDVSRWISSKKNTSSSKINGSNHSTERIQLLARRKKRRCYIESRPMVMNKLVLHCIEIFLICFSLCLLGSLLSFYLWRNMKIGNHHLLWDCYRRRTNNQRNRIVLLDQGATHKGCQEKFVICDFQTPVLKQ